MRFKSRKKFEKRSIVNFPKSKTYSYRSSPNLKTPNSEISSNKLPGSISRKHTISILFNSLTAVAVVSSLFYLSVIDPRPVIKIDSKNIPRDESAYINAAGKELNSSIFNKNKLTFDTAKFKTAMENQFPEIDDLTVSMPILKHRPIVSIMLAKPVAVLLTDNKNYVLDSSGRALFEDKFASSGVDLSHLVSINDNSNHPVQLGKPVVTEKQINYINDLTAYLAEKNVQPEAFNLEFGGSTLDVKLKGLNYAVKFSFYEDVRQSSGAFLAIKNNIDNNKIEKPAKYIDLRIPDKAFIK